MKFLIKILVGFRRKKIGTDIIIYKNTINYYKNTTKKINIEIPHRKFIPCVFPNWDNSPRSGNKSLVLQHSSPEIFGLYLQKMIEKFQKDPQNQPYIVIKSWNEWAEGNYLEPDEKHGRAWLKVIKDIKSKIE